MSDRAAHAAAAAPSPGRSHPAAALLQLRLPSDLLPSDLPPPPAIQPGAMSVQPYAKPADKAGVEGGAEAAPSHRIRITLVCTKVAASGGPACRSEHRPPTRRRAL